MHKTIALLLLLALVAAPALADDHALIAQYEQEMADACTEADLERIKHLVKEKLDVVSGMANQRVFFA